MSLSVVSAAVIVAVPGAIASTLPSVTVAAAALLVLHVTLLSVKLSGLTIAVSVSVSPTDSVRALLFKLTLFVSVAGVFTVTVHDASNPPSDVFAVMVAVPCATAVTVPLLISTVAIFGLFELHITALFVAFAGATVAASFSVWPSSRLSVGLFRLTPVTFTSVTLSETFTLQVAV